MNLQLHFEKTQYKTLSKKSRLKTSFAYFLVC